MYKIFLLIVVLISALNPVVSLSNDQLKNAGKVEKEDGVLVLNDDNFDDEVKKHKVLLVAFVAEWCGFCKRLAPEYAAAAEVLGVMNSPLYIAKVDA